MISSGRAASWFQSAFFLFTAFMGAMWQFPAAARGQSSTDTGTIEFVARVTPASGRSEPVLRQTFFLLRKSFADIRKEAEETEPKPQLDKFVDGLDISKELKAWMKRTHSTQLSGEEFRRLLKPDDVIDVTEFMNAYILDNSVNVDVGFPRPKYREKDKTANPERYERDRKAYLEQVRAYLKKNPNSIEGIEIHLAEMDPTPLWNRELESWRKRAHERSFELAQTSHLAAKTDTDLEGRGTFRAAPGTYWISSLEREAMAGEVRLSWDVPVLVQAGQVTRLELSNINAVHRAR